ncbi:MAG: glutamine--fructose-6-phosphate transaminase (isomerizing) [Thermotogae bacterium]|nr:glutamine--fructose-6-phosphate transaminase (isomerizing) [Thermotogota bacterium]
MCGIFGFVGEGGKVRDLVDALKKLEYRGYDSAGVAFWDEDAVRLFKIKGKVSDLETALGDILDLDIKGGIAHTRWATHGEPNDVNAHPHFDCERKIFVVHNGIIENHKELRKELEKRGHRFVSDTDTEVLAHLIEENYYGNILEALRRILPLLRGSYAVVAMHSDEVGILAAARKGSPLVIGKNENFCVVASDITPILKYTKEVIFLDEGETVSVGGTVDFVGLKDSVEKRIFHISWSERDAEKGGYKHFMLKEIMEEPEVLKNAMAGRMKGSKVEFEELKGWEDFLSNVEKVKMIACGTSHHAGMLFKYFIEDLIQIEVETDVASEMRYRKTKVDDETLFIAISQSGETADTLETVRKIKEKGGRVLSLCNVLGSTLTRESDRTIFLNAGPEISVASTKAYVAQVVVLLLLGVELARIKGKNIPAGFLDDLRDIHARFEEILGNSNLIRDTAREFVKFRNFMYIGRWMGYPSALEGALKLKEISYTNATAYPAGELKHGPIALLDEDFPVFAIVPTDRMKEKMLNNIMEVKARKAKVVGVVTEGDDEVFRLLDHTLKIPKVHEYLYPLVMAPVLQLFAYFIADERGLDVDKPRNLAKSVTVE